MRKLLLITCWGALLPLAPLYALDMPLAPPGNPSWTALTFPKIDAHTTYTVNRIDGRDAVTADSRCAAARLPPISRREANCS